MPDLTIAICTSIGRGKEYAIPIAKRVLPVISQSIGADTFVVNDAPEATNVDGLNVINWPGCGEQFGMGLRHERLARMRQWTLDQVNAAKYDFIYWHDIDVVPPPDIILKLLKLWSQVVHYNVHVLSGTCYMRNVVQPRIIGYEMRGDVTPRVPNTGEYLTVGLGCCLVDSLAMGVPFKRNANDGMYIGEDFVWCADVSRRGLGNVILDYTLPCWHCSEDGSANFPIVGEQKVGIAWGGTPFQVSNNYGLWVRDVPRFDVPLEAYASMGVGFYKYKVPELGIVNSTITDALSYYGYGDLT